MEPQGRPLSQAWLRFFVAPSKPLQDARVVASLAIMVGKPERVDMAFTRAHVIFVDSGEATHLGNKNSFSFELA